MNVVEKADNRELAEISIVLPPFSPPPQQQQQQQQQQAFTATVVESSAAAITNTTSPAPVQTSITGNLISIPMHLATSRMVCLRTPAQDCPSLAQTIYPITSSSKPSAASTGHPIFISTSPNPTITPSNPYSASSNGSAFVGSDEDKVFLDRRRKRPAPSLASTRQNKSRVHSVSESAVLDESDTAALSPREQRALRRKEKSRLAAKLRRNQESNILSCLLQALPVSLTDPSANSDGNSTSKSPSGLNLEKSGVIRMAGQTLFLYNSLSRVLGSKAVPFISLLSKSLFGLLVHPSDSTVVYATPPLADAISWPWINLIGMSLENLIDDGKMPSKPGETVRLRMLEQIGSPSKNAAHLSTHNRPTTPLRSPSHSPNSTVSNSTNSGGDQTSSLWSPHLYRSSNNGISSGASGTQYPASTGCGKTVPYLLCSCFAILRVPITRPEEMKPSSSADKGSTTTSPSTHLNLYLLQPTPNLCFLKDSSENASSCSLLGLSQLGKATSSIPLKLNSLSSPASTSSFHRSKERYFLNRQRRLLMQNPPPNLASEDESVTPRRLFCTVLDQNLNVKWIESSGNVKASIFSSMTGQAFLNFVSLDDLQTVGKLLTECIQRKASVWTPSYRLRIPDTQLNGNQRWMEASKFIWVRSLLSISSEINIRCLHQPIGDVQLSGIQIYLHQPKSTPENSSQSKGRQLVGSSSSSSSSSSLSLGSTNTIITQVKRPIRVLKLQPQRPSLPPQPVQPTPTLQPISVTSNLPNTPSGPFLAPARDAQIIYDTTTCLTPQTIVTTPWVIYARGISTPQAELVKPLTRMQPTAQTVSKQPFLPTSTLPPILTPQSAPPKLPNATAVSQNSCFSFLLSCESNDGPSPQHFNSNNNKIPLLGPPHSLVEPVQNDKRPSVASSPALNLPDMLQELDPETLAMLENEDAKSDSPLTSLSFDDILSSISITPSSGDELNQEKATRPSGSFCSSEYSPPSLPESFVSSASCSGNDQNHQTQSQQNQQSHQQNISLLNDVEIDTDLPSDSDEFWDAFVTNVMNLPLDSTNLPMDVC